MELMADIPPPAFWVLLSLAPIIAMPMGRMIRHGAGCEACHRKSDLWDYMPAGSWGRLIRGCPDCGARNGLQPGLDLFCVAIVLWASIAANGWELSASCLLGWILLALAIIDQREAILPDSLTGLLTVCGLGYAYIFQPSYFNDHLIGAIAGGVTFFSVTLLYRLLRGRDGLGLGDAKLLAGIGAWLSWKALPSVVLVASMLALMVVLSQGFLRKRLKGTDKIPFGPFLAAAGWLVWIYGM